MFEFRNQAYELLEVQIWLMVTRLHWIHGLHNGPPAAFARTVLTPEAGLRA